MKTILLVLLITVMSARVAKAQNNPTDSVSVIKAAKHDAKAFRYNKADKQGVKNNLHNPNSDYFKPTSGYVSQASYLSDSLYVKTFKHYALHKTRARRTTGTLLIVGGSVVVLFAVMLVAAVSSLSGLQ